MIDLLAQTMVEAESFASNPVSDFLYDLLPIAGALAGALLLAFRKRVETWANYRREGRFAHLLAPILEQQEERDTAIVAILESIHDRLPPSAEDVEAALEVIKKAGIADDPPG